MIDYENIIFLLAVGIVSLIVTIYLLLTSKKDSSQKQNEAEMADVKVFSTQIKLIPFIYFSIVFIMFILGVFTDFLNYSIFGFIIALIPFLAYLIFDYRKGKNVRRK